MPSGGKTLVLFDVDGTLTLPRKVIITRFTGGVFVGHLFSMLAPWRPTAFDLKACPRVIQDSDQTMKDFLQKLRQVRPLLFVLLPVR